MNRVKKVSRRYRVAKPEIEAASLRRKLVLGVARQFRGKPKKEIMEKAKALQVRRRTVMNYEQLVMATADAFVRGMERQARGN